MFKDCSACEQTKPIGEFYAKSRSKDYSGLAGYSNHCKDCDRKARSEYVATHLEKCSKADRAYHLRKTYGLTTVDYNRMLESQAGCCAICNRHQLEFKRRLVVDHDHSTGEIRGLLCIPCNLAIGYVKDAIPVLLSAIKYLEKHKPELADNNTNVVDIKSAKKVG